MGGQVLAVSGREEQRRRDAAEPGRHRLHHRDHAQRGEPGLKVGGTDRAVLDTMPQTRGARRLDRVAHRFDRAITDRMGRDLKAGAARAIDQRAQLFRGGSPDTTARAHGDPFRSAVHEHFDRAGTQHRPAKAPEHAESRRGFQQLP